MPGYAACRLYSNCSCLISSIINVDLLQRSHLSADRHLVLVVSIGLMCLGRLSSLHTSMSRQGTHVAPRATSRSTSRSGSRSESRAKAGARAVSRSQLSVNTAATAKRGTHRLSIIPSEASDVSEEQAASGEIFCL